MATVDGAINPYLEHFMTKRAGTKTIQINASHTVYISHPEEVAKLIEQVATGSNKS